MAVFFRIKSIDKTIYIEINAFGISYRIDVCFINDGLLIINKRTKKKIKFKKTNSSINRDLSKDIPFIDKELCTIYRKGSHFYISYNNHLILSSKVAPKDHIILIFDLIKNNRGPLFEEKGKKASKIDILKKIQIDVKLTIEFHYTRIILYLFKILKIIRRKNHGSNV